MTASLPRLVQKIVYIRRACAADYEAVEWLDDVSEDQFVFGMYRRHMKTIGYLGQIDKLYGAPATTRNWNTIAAILRILKGHSNPR